LPPPLKRRKVLAMTDEEKAILRLIAETTKQAAELQDRMGRMLEKNQSTDAEVELLCALLDSLHVQQKRLEALRAGVNQGNPSN